MSIREIFHSMEYGPALEERGVVDQWLNDHNNRFDLFIDGDWQSPHSEHYFPSINPADGMLLAEVAQADDQDVDRAVKSAQVALTDWMALGGHKRARFLYAIARQVQKHARLFAVLESLDNGKPIHESRDVDIPLVVRHFYHHAGWAQVMDQELPNYQPIGVIGQIIPWNFPLLMLAWKIAPALAMGNTLVLKPAELTSLTALLFAQICQSVGLPRGVINIITGDGSTGGMLVQHPEIAKIAFTGSTEVGKTIRRRIAGSGKKLSLELGGKSPFILFEDADLDSAIEGVVDAIWFNQGEVCFAGSRILVQESVADRFEEKLRARMQTLRLGQPLDKGIDMGAIVDPQQLDKISSMVEAGVNRGAQIWQADLTDDISGCFYPPTLFTHMSPSDPLSQQEIFGPVVVSIRFRTPSEAVSIANNSRNGLAASIWTENINLALDISPKIKAGVIWINASNLFDAASGFGGYKESGFGREGGKEGLYEYVKLKTEFSTPPTEPLIAKSAIVKSVPIVAVGSPKIDRTAKLYIGGLQVRSDSGYSLMVQAADGDILGEVPQGSRKDIRNGVEAAQKATGWTNVTGHHRAQVLYYIAENLSARQQEFSGNIAKATGMSEAAAVDEVEMSISRIYTYAAMADKYDGAVHQTLSHCITIAMQEALGVIGIICPKQSPLLGLISTIMPAIAMGNRVVVVPASDYPLIATDFYQILETSDLPAGVVNIITGDDYQLAKVLAEHYDVEAVWYFGDQTGSQMVELAAAGNMKRTWVNYGQYRDWKNTDCGQGEQFLREATQVKNIWIPYGE